ncbi:flavin monoamine oxidase family protein [Streptomyces violascens]|uniref:flavin monoamine oxidase family protein n=1 Tax=Streptomyces violascens TaxID=67381 RepID=UPI0036A538F9
MVGVNDVWPGGSAGPKRRHGRRVTVVGAGIAGLVAAYELEGLGYRVEVLEGNDRVGGRIRTHRFGAGDDAPSVELGAMRIPTRHWRTLGYIDQLGLGDRIRRFSTLLSDENAFIATDGGHTRIRDASEVLCGQFRREAAFARYSDATITFGAWLTAVVDAIAPPDLRRALRSDLRDQLLDLVEKIDLTSFLHGSARDRVDLHFLFSAHPGLRSACSRRLNSFLDDILTETSPALLRLAGGMDQLPRRLAERLQAKVSCGHKVVGIEVRDDDVLLHVRTDTRRFVRRTDFAVCTVPFPVLRRMWLSGFDADKRAVLNDTVYCPATKVAFHCREPFWLQEGITGGASFSGGRIRQTYYPSAEEAADRGAALLASYTIGEEADWLGRLPAAQRYRVVLKELGVMHPQVLRPGMVLGAASVVWGRSPWTLGGCATRWGKDAAAREQERLRAARPVNRLFFAGEHSASVPAWIEGAIESALHAVRQIAEYEPPRGTAHSRHRKTLGAPR